MNLVERINSGVDSFVGVIEHTAASLAIPVADGVVAWLAAENMMGVLGFSKPVAIMTGVALEGVGIVASRAALAVRYYNQVKPEAEPRALEWLAWAILGLQFGIGAVLVTVNTVATSAMTYGLLTIAVLSGLGTLAHMLENDIKARPSQRDISPSAQPAATMAEPALAVDEMSPRARVLAYYTLHADATQQAAASACGISRPRVGQLLAELEREGAISRNGEVKVLA